MFANALKIAWRNVVKHKGCSLLNIAGLAVGMTVCILILMFVRYELSYDTFHEHAERVYRLERVWYSGDGSIRGGFCSLAPSFVPFLEKDFPELEHVVRFFKTGPSLVTVENTRFIEDRFYLAEADMFEVFSLPLVKGRKDSVLKDPGSLVLSESMARKYFGDMDPIGRQVGLDQRALFQVTGIMRDMPKNSHARFDFIGSFSTLKGQDRYRGTQEDYFFGSTNFTDNVTHVYARLASGAVIKDVQARIPAFLNKTLGTRRDADGNTILAGQESGILFRKLTDVHLNSHTSTELEANGDIRYVRIFSIIAVFVLLIACINFMNLSTARAAHRAREVGLRKVVGANRRLLTAQFLGESLLLSLLALGIALVLVAVLLPWFRTFAAGGVYLSQLFQIQGALILMGVVGITGLAAGLYPAVYLAAYKPVTILRGDLTRGSRGARLRRGLVIFQFAVSIALIVCVGGVARQMRFLRDSDLGFQRENILLIPSDQVIGSKWREIKTDLESSPHILSAAVSKRAPTGRLNDAPGWRAEVDGEVLNNPFSMPHNVVGHDFFKTYGIEIIAGRDFSREHATDEEEAFILNETAVWRLGFERPEDAIGMLMSTFASNRKGRVIGVARDFNYESLHFTIRPILTYVDYGAANTVSVRATAGRAPDAVAHARAVWARFNPESPLSFDFLEDRINQLYRNEQRMMQMFAVFSLLAIGIACLGLFGLASFTAEQRTREIGVRKVLGASAGRIVMLLSMDFARWVLAANLLAWPAAYLVMSRWLENFAYRAPLSGAIFFFAAGLTFLIALLTVIWQSLRAAGADPARSLRYE